MQDGVDDIEQVRRRIASGQLSAGQEIPSVRELAQTLAVHPMTVSKAFGLLEAEGFLLDKQGALECLVQLTGEMLQYRRPPYHKSTSKRLRTGR